MATSAAPILAALFAIAMVALGAWRLWHRREELDALVEDESASSPARFLPSPEEQERALSIVLHPTRLSFSLVKLALDLRIDLANSGPGHLVGLRVAADMTSTGPGQETGSALLVGPDLGHAHTLTIPRIDPGERVEAAFQLQVPVAGIDTIAQDDAHLLLPLVRLRVLGAGTPLRRFHFVVGLKPERDGGLLRPIRADHGPRIYTALGARQVD